MFSRAQFAAAFRAMLPRGVIWRREPDAVQSVVVDALATTYQRSSERAEELLADALPVRPVELIGEWEETLGLPDPCVGVQSTLQQRQRQVATRFAAAGGQSPSYYIKVAADLGFTATVEEFVPGLIVDVGTVEQPLTSDPAWSHIWRLNISTTVAITEFAAGSSVAGDPLRVWGNNGLECIINRIKPAHTSVFYTYS